MAWALPKEKLTSGYILDADDFNANIASFVQEYDGNLNEQNFNATCLEQAMRAGKAADDIAVRLYSRKTPISPQGATGPMFEIPQTPSWVEVGGTVKNFTSPGGMALVIISFQLTTPGAVVIQSGLNFCVELDGAAQMNSLLGTGDQGNEFMATGEGYTVGGGDITFDAGTSPSVRARQMRHQVKGTYRLSPGEHTVRLLARNLFVQQDAAQSQFVSQRETIILHGWC